MARSLQIATDGGDGPALRMQIHNGASPLVGIDDLCVGRIAARGHTWFGPISQDPLNRMVAWLAAKAQETNPRHLMMVKAGIFGLQIDDELPHIRWKATPLIRGRNGLFGEEADHPVLIKLVSLVMQSAFAGPDLFGTCSRRLPKQDCFR